MDATAASAIHGFGTKSGQTRPGSGDDHARVLVLGILPERGNVDLQGAPDHAVWEYAKSGDFAIVSKDEDFHHLSFHRGPPPKVVWVKSGNCTTGDVERALRENRPNLLEFDDDEDAAFMVVAGGMR